VEIRLRGTPAHPRTGVRRLEKRLMPAVRESQRLQAVAEVRGKCGGRTRAARTDRLRRSATAQVRAHAARSTRPGAQQLLDLSRATRARLLLEPALEVPERSPRDSRIALAKTHRRPRARPQPRRPSRRTRSMRGCQPLANRVAHFRNPPTAHDRAHERRCGRPQLERENRPE
jgi:hypothetical protein